MRLHTIAMLFVVGATLACQRSENRYLTRSVAPTEVPGVWTATTFGIESLRDAGHTKHLVQSEHVLEIRPDGTCLFQSFADPSSSGGVDEGFVRSECKWSLGNVGHQALMIHLRGQPTDVLGPHFCFDEEKGQLQLWQYAGDPDAWKYVEFIKRSNEPQQARASS